MSVAEATTGAGKGAAEPRHHSVIAEKLGDLPALTGLRFFAAFLILVGHGTRMMLKLTPEPQLALEVANTFLEIGMELFFVLSGFVIHYNYADIGHDPTWRNLAKFYIARLARIYPLYLLFLSLNLGLYWHLYDLTAIPFWLGMTQSWIFVLLRHIPLHVHISTAHVAWSISTEWFFYCLYPIVGWVLAFPRSRVTAALGLIAVAWLGLVVVASLLLHEAEVTAFAERFWGPQADVWVTQTGHSFFEWLIAFSPVGRLPYFLIGVATAHIFIALYRKPVSEAELRLGTILVVLALAGVMLMSGAQSTGSRLPNSAPLFVYSSCIAVLLFCCARYKSIFSRALSVPLLIVCGDASYSIYLFHFPVLGSVEIGDSVPWTFSNVSVAILRFATAAVMTVMFAIAVYRAFEAPARKATRAYFSRFIQPGASRADLRWPVILAVGIPVVLSIVGWLKSLI